jgi:glyoxylase-like metal-dependent hydrolase (beta-lactamase superfamily II)
MTYSDAHSRRAFLASAGLAATAAWLGPRRLFAQEAGAATQSLVAVMRKEAITAKITVEKLRGNISVLIGSGGNIAVQHGKDGKLLVDGGMAGSRPQLTEALTGVSADPVKHLVNTHWHFDHTDGNEWLHSCGALILAHENVRKRLAAGTRVEDWDFTFAPSPTDALPAIGLSHGATLHLNGDDIAVEYFGLAHTDGDVSVSFKNADVFHTGDTWWNGHYPFIDYSTGGSIGGMIRAAESTLAKVGPKTVIIPGHGPVGDRTQLTEFRDMLTAIRDRVVVEKKAGKSVQEVVAAKPTAQFDAKWGTFVINGDFFTRLVYAGV